VKESSPEKVREIAAAAVERYDALRRLKKGAKKKSLWGVVVTIEDAVAIRDLVRKFGRDAVKQMADATAAGEVIK
jgi:hypothetical protein